MSTSNRLTVSHWTADGGDAVLETTIGGVLRSAAARAPDRVALVAGGGDPAGRRQWSYAELLAEAERAAKAMRARFEPGEPVAVCAGNVPEWVLLEFAAGLAGVTLVTVNPAYRPNELEYVLAHSRARGVFVAREYRGSPLPEMVAGLRARLPELREVIVFDEWASFCESAEPHQRLPEVDAGQPAQVLYTSGTTGQPKGAVLNHRGLTNNARLASQAFPTAEGEVGVNPMPLFHVVGCCLIALGIAQSLGTHLLLPGFDPGLQLHLIEAVRSPLLGGVPTMLIALLEHPDFGRRDLSCLRYVLSGGATVPADLVRRVEATLDIPLLITYGQTEASCAITMTRPDDSPDDRAETLGRPLPSTELRIVDPATGTTVAPGVVGEICTRGYHVMQAYLHNPDATRAAIDRDGWLHTGDLGSMDERGYCRIEGRLKEMIIRGGENIYPSEIEAVIFSHPQVAEVAVIGVDDRFWGEEVAAVIRPAVGGPPSEAALVELCRGRLAPFKVPSRWIFVDSFPLTPSGKIRKHVLKEQLAPAAGVH